VTGPADPYALLRELQREQAKPAPPEPAPEDVTRTMPTFTADLGPLSDDARADLARALRDTANRAAASSIRPTHPIIVTLRELAAAARAAGPVKVRVTGLDREARATLWRILGVAVRGGETGPASVHLRALADKWERFTFGEGGYQPDDTDCAAARSRGVRAALTSCGDRRETRGLTASPGGRADRESWAQSSQLGPDGRGRRCWAVASSRCASVGPDACGDCSCPGARPVARGAHGLEVLVLGVVGYADEVVDFVGGLAAVCALRVCL
jgi:hypothetical protein